MERDVGPDGPVGGNDNCKPSAAHPYPVVLVHATFADEGSNWVTVAPLLANAGYCVYAFNYGETILSAVRPHRRARTTSNTRPKNFDSFVNQVLSKTKSVQGRPRRALAGRDDAQLLPEVPRRRVQGERVRRAGAEQPRHDARRADELLDNFPFAPGLNEFLECIGAPALSEQEVGSAFEKHLFEGGDTVAGPRYVVIETTHDEVVTPYTNAFLSGSNVTNITVQNQCPSDPVEHIGMFEDSPALQNVLNQLSASPNPSFTATCSKYGLGL